MSKQSTPPSKKTFLTHSKPLSSKEIAELLPELIQEQDSSGTWHFMRSSSFDPKTSQPEGLAMMALDGLSTTMRKDLLQRLFNKAANASNDEIEQLASLAAAIGRYNFSFPIWRFWAQGYGKDKKSLLEHFGMTKLDRSTDHRDLSLPDPDRDEFGKGFIYENADWYIEYRRAYIICSYKSTSSPATVILRNSSYYYGRDRLPDNAYVSFEPLTIDQIKALNADHLDNFTPIQDMNLGDIYRTQKLLKRLDIFDKKLANWLIKDPNGKKKLYDFLKDRIENPKGGKPYLALIRNNTAPWHPIVQTQLTPEVVDSLAKPSEHRSKDLENLLHLAGEDNYKFILMSGPKGDHPVINRPAPK